MDYDKIGTLITKLRKEKGMTQKALADKMNISDRTISRWERGIGCPELSLLAELSNILGVNIEKILSGSLNPNHADGGNMKKIKFYVCPVCGNAIFCTSHADISCCGRKLAYLTAEKANHTHDVTINQVDEGFYCTFPHEMTKQHFISFAAYVTCDRVLFMKLYPEQNAEIQFPKMNGGQLFFYCNQHGLFMA